MYSVLNNAAAEVNELPDSPKLELLEKSQLRALIYEQVLNQIRIARESQLRGVIYDQVFNHTRIA